MTLSSRPFSVRNVRTTSSPGQSSGFVPRCFRATCRMWYVLPSPAVPVSTTFVGSSPVSSFPILSTSGAEIVISSTSCVRASA